MSVLVIAEHDNKELKSVTFNTITAAHQMRSGDVTVLVIGHHCEKIAAQVAGIEHVSKVVLADHEVYAHQLAENTAKLIVSIASDFTAIVAAASAFGKDLLPRVAALLDVVQISDVIKIESSDTFVRPIYAGNAIMTVQSQDPIKVVTVRASVFAAAKTTSQHAPITALATVIALTRSRFIRHELNQSTRPTLTSARIVIAGGRGLQSAENFKIVEGLADKLGAAIGASRAAVDAGFAPNDYQVGQTGKVVAPDLYIAIGISGAIQHLAGMKESKVIVAINKDPDAPIFQIADYGLVGDLFKILPEMMAALAQQPAKV